jgi:hypothetical protein
VLASLLTFYVILLMAMSEDEEIATRNTVNGLHDL